MNAFVYILLSGRDGRYYVGSTDNLIRRYQQHAPGCVHTTSRMLPVTVIGWKQFDSLAEARRAERALKRKKSRAFVARWLGSQSPM